LMMNLIQMRQVHGSNIVHVDKNDAGRIMENCDALISNDSKVTLSVHVADCLPISVVDKKSRSFGVIHAGWRGLEKEIIVKTIQKMVKEFSAGPSGFEVSIGPHICRKHYEVKSDVSSKFTKYPDSVSQKNGKKFLDLAKIAEFQLLSVGIRKENIKIDKRCTFEDLSLPSFRRDKIPGRLVVSLNIQSS
jgi:YfiH family protein